MTSAQSESVAMLTRFARRVIEREGFDSPNAVLVRHARDKAQHEWLIGLVQTYTRTKGTA